ncbi:hypothetical protein CQW23_16110 [Capsicum baccatum]|uniref:FLZ-type domain-containing protein n=1 Tax=Capsicum baccatum TaxID=33114 RepID=A0A2G2WP02_CAPBA|nr:hypothetical protein CQW23_16110 [Capsicum baccatum]
MSKRARVNRNDRFDQPNYPNKNSSFKPPSYFTNNATAAAASAAIATPAIFSSFGMTSNVGGIPNECFFCKKNFKKENHTYMYRSLAFCTEECREVQISFDDNMMKARMEAANKKGSHPFCTEECRESRMDFDEDLMMMEELEMDSDEDLMMEKLEISGKKN